MIAFQCFNLVNAQLLNHPDHVLQTRARSFGHEFKLLQTLGTDAGALREVRYPRTELGGRSDRLSQSGNGQTTEKRAAEMMLQGVARALADRQNLRRRGFEIGIMSAKENVEVYCHRK